jgi:glycosyltransferase involved in cell wall biosynthesis
MSSIAQGCADVTIATTHADIPAVVDANAALLGPPEDIATIAALMRRLSRNSHEWAARAEAGRRQVAGKHDPDRLAGALEDLYDSVRG